MINSLLLMLFMGITIEPHPNDFIDSVLFNGVPSGQPRISEQLFQNGCVAWILKILIDIISDEIEKSAQMGIASAFGLLLGAFGYSAEE